MLKKDYAKIKEELDNCSNPLFFFHDDADGISSFLILYRYKREGHGVIVKSRPIVDMKLFRKVEEYSPDKIFVLDLAQMDPEFVKKAGCPVVWIDHHEPQHIDGVRYFNPQRSGKHEPTSATCYEAIKEDLWIAMAGMVGDWYLPPYTERFYELYPDLFDGLIDTPGKAMFQTKIGEIGRVMTFVVKGTTTDALKCVKIFTRIKTPTELLNEESSGAKYIMKKYKKMNSEYQELLREAKKKARKSPLLVFEYSIDKTSFTGELANELLYLYPGKIIIIARKKSGEMRCSLRSTGEIKIREYLEKALVGLEGYGGGHEHACGAAVKEEDWKEFLKRIEELAKG